MGTVDSEDTGAVVGEEEACEWACGILLATEGELDRIGGSEVEDRNGERGTCLVQGPRILGRGCL
jgi:hypothetical protein